MTYCLYSIREWYKGLCCRTLLLSKKEPTNCDYSQIHRLCVFASGFLMIVICKFFVSIKLSCLHFGQYKGKFLSMVSILSLLRVLFPHIGQNIHSGVITIYLPLCVAFFFSCRKAYWRSFSASRCSRLFVFLSSLFCSCCNFRAC